LVPDANVPVEFVISGGKLQAVSNSNPKEMHSFQQPKVNTYRGKCQVIVRLEKPGVIHVSAKSEGLTQGEGKTNVVSINTK
jgi:beta-galactosidase